jgi:hypothetical protein
MQSLHSPSKLSHHGLVVSLCSLHSFLRLFIVCVCCPFFVAMVYC